MVCQITNELVEILGHRGFKGELLIAEGVSEGKRSGMKRQACTGFIPFSIPPVSHHRVSDAGEVYADLMFPTS